MNTYRKNENDLKNKTGFGYTCPNCDISEVYYVPDDWDALKKHHIVYCSRIEENRELGCGQPFIMKISHKTKVEVITLKI